MIASKIPADHIKAAADDVGVRAEIEPLSGSGLRHRVKLYPRTTPDMYFEVSGRRKPGERGDARYQRESVGWTSGRRVNAVCWHGFRDFFRACFERSPDAIFYTVFDTWRGSEDFEARYMDSGYRNIGSVAFPTFAAEACRCPESGMAV